MDSGSIGLIVFLAILILFAAYFSATETAFSSVNRIRLKNSASDGNKKAAYVLKLLENYDRLLTTILICSNLVTIAASALATVLFVKYYGNAGVTVSTVVTTLVVLLFGEVTPKSLAKDFPEKFAAFSAPVIHFFIVIFFPLSWLFSKLKQVLRLIFKKSADPGITEEELIIMVEEAESDGGINAQESELIRSAIEFGELEAEDILTPRVDVIAVDIKSAREDIWEQFNTTAFSRLPVYETSVDNIIGVINQKDFSNPNNAKSSLKKLMKPVLYVVPSMKISKILTLLQKNKSHIAVVTDEFGGTQGIVTMEDILEELVGEIWDEHDDVIEECRKVGEGEYIVRCEANLDKMMEMIGLDNELDIPTVGGWVMEMLEKVPVVGDSFTYENLLVTVTKADPRRAVEVSVVVLEDIDADDE